MVTAEQFGKMRDFIFRHGDLLTRRRFAYHFENGCKQDVLDVLACYQNDDGGFGNGLELDLMCPPSSGICTEVALGYLLELGVADGPILQRAIEWILSNQTENGDLPHPVEAAKSYPHGNWWQQDSNRILSVAGLLGKMGRDLPEISSRAAEFFENNCVPFPEEIGVYSYPIALYLQHSDGADRFPQSCEKLAAAFPIMLEKEAWHHPLFFCSNRWDSPDIPMPLWQSEAKRALATLQDDGGVLIERYGDLSWWRPVWTLDMLVIMKEKGLLDNVSF